MPQRPSKDWPRLSGRPEGPTSHAQHPNQTVFRRFFDLIERLEKPRATPANKAHGGRVPTPGKGAR